MKFAPGEVLVRRHWRGGRVSLMQVVRVAADDEHGLRLWLPVGSPYWRLVAEDGADTATRRSTSCAVPGWPGTPGPAATS